MVHLRWHTHLLEQGVGHTNWAKTNYWISTRTMQTVRETQESSKKILSSGRATICDGACNTRAGARASLQPPNTEKPPKKHTVCSSHARPNQKESTGAWSPRTDHHFKGQTAILKVKLRFYQTLNCVFKN